jgi:hypothetical protein
MTGVSPLFLLINIVVACGVGTPKEMLLGVKSDRLLVPDMIFNVPVISERRLDVTV